MDPVDQASPAPPSRETWWDTLAIAAGTGIGVACAAAMWWWGVDRTDGNHLHEGFASTFRRPASFVLFGACGGLFGALVRWVAGGTARGPSPLFGWLVGIMCGGGVAVVGSAVGLSSRSALGAIAVAGVAAGAWAAGRVRFAPRVPPSARRVVSAIVAIALVAGLAGVVPRSSWPGDGATAEARTAWARATFGSSFDRAAEYLSQHVTLVSTLGRVVVVTPAAGVNRQRTSPFGRRGEFTLRVEGESGGGIATLTFSNATKGEDLPAWNFRATWTPDGGEAVELE